MSTEIPLSLRRKIVVVFDAGRLVPQALTPQEEERAEGEFANAVKMLAWIKANILRRSKDHVFLVAVLNNTKVFDKSVISEVFYSLGNEGQKVIDKPRIAEAVLGKLGDKLRPAGISYTVEVVQGPECEKAVEYCHQHKCELAFCQDAQAIGISRAMWWSWSDRFVKQCPCPCTLIRANELSDSLFSIISKSISDSDDDDDDNNEEPTPTVGDGSESPAPPLPQPQYRYYQSSHV
ncbi:hypothetical protein EV182_002662 [Spiromyces aspiralis]|uniref:Uncharacterized protein n=1 Tax=Spiromyces aspiralis TaxID=68401 RepID=A0ACC1HZ44_9FUNG|nr:hypothetical protein EV182_002662 [Spiromyces aspiralis]